MRIEIWSDIVCPWCYIGKRRFETALARFPHRDRVELVWRSFLLDPHAPHMHDLTSIENLSRKYGVTEARAREMTDHVTRVAAQEGLTYRLEQARPASTIDAHRLLHLASTRGLQHTLKERLMRAYFTEGAHIADHATLTRLATEAGLGEQSVRDVLATNAYATDVQADLDRARQLGITGVPYFVIDARYGVSGAQSAETLLGVLNEAWAKTHAPLVTVGADGDRCEDDSCAI